MTDFQVPKDLESNIAWFDAKFAPLGETLDSQRWLIIREHLRGVVGAASALLTQADGSMVGAGYKRGGGNVVMALEVSVNNVCELRDAIERLNK